MTSSIIINRKTTTRSESGTSVTTSSLNDDDDEQKKGSTSYSNSNKKEQENKKSDSNDTKIKDNNNKNMNRSQKRSDWSGGDGLIPGRDVLGPIALMLITPCFSIIYYHVCTHLNGDFIQFMKLCWHAATTTENNGGGGGGLMGMMYDIWPNAYDTHTWYMILMFMFFELILMRVMPGKTFTATITPNGYRPTYKANGMISYVVTLCTLWLLAWLQLFNPSQVYDKFGNILASMNLFAWIFCTILLIKGYVAPSTSDSGTTGSIIQDFYWGMELYPRIGTYDVKQFTNCRFGMMSWAVLIVCYSYKNMELNNGRLLPGMFVSVLIQLVYISKFFLWEMGYMCSMDIQHDRAGYYICWGCLVWIPAIYTSTSYYLVQHCPTNISNSTAIAIACLGILCVYINYDSDHQRYKFRQSSGRCTIWGNQPPKHIIAKYTTSSGQEKQSLLLVDGYWKISRHFHYVPEILASFFWSCSAMNTALIAPYFYVVYLTILLIDRAYRDDDRCQRKYGIYWNQYCHEVPYKIIPGIL